MPSQHKHRPIPFRPPEGDRARLLALAERTGQPVNRILAEALSIYLDGHGVPDPAHSTEEGTGRHPRRIGEFLSDGPSLPELDAYGDYSPRREGATDGDG